MEAALFAKMMSDKSVTDLKKLGYKYPQADIAEFIGLLKTGFQWRTSGLSGECSPSPPFGRQDLADAAQ